MYRKMDTTIKVPGGGEYVEHCDRGLHEKLSDTTLPGVFGESITTGIDGFTLDKVSPELIEITPSRKIYEPIHIYFHEMNSILGPMPATPSWKVFPVGVENKWRYRSITRRSHPWDMPQIAMTQEGKQDFVNRSSHMHLGARPNSSYNIKDMTSEYFWSWLNEELPPSQALSSGGARYNMVYQSYAAALVQKFVRRAIANGITYHTKTSSNRYVRNCPHFCWPEIAWHVNCPLPENMYFQMIRYYGGVDGSGNQKTPANDTSGFTSWANGGRDQFQRVDFYEHRSKYKEATKDELDSLFWRKQESIYTSADVNMLDFSINDYIEYVGIKGWRKKEWWECEDNMNEVFKYWCSTPSWNLWPKRPVPENETDEQQKQRQWDDYNDFKKASKEGARPGRAVRIDLPLPPGNYGPMISGLRSYSWFPLDLTRGKDDPVDEWGNFFDTDSGWDWEAHRASDFTYDVSNTTSMKLDWWDLFEITEGVGDGYKKGSPLWDDVTATPATKIDTDLSMGEGHSVKTGNETDGYSSRCVGVGGDIEANSEQGSLVNWLLFEVTEDRRPKEIHFFAVPRGLKWVTELGVGAEATWEERFTIGPTNRNNLRIRGPYSILNQMAGRFGATVYEYIYAVLLGTMPGSIAWIIEIVWQDGTRTSYTVWTKKAWKPKDIHTWYGIGSSQVLQAYMSSAAWSSSW